MSNPDQDGKIFVGKSDKPEMLALAFGNRHGLVTGATGTGKTVTLQTMAEGFSRAGVPVFAADIKGDLSGIAAPGERQGSLRQARQGHRLRIRDRRIPGRVLGLVRRAGPSDPRHRVRDGPAAAVAHPRSQRRAGRRPQHRVPLCRRRVRQDRCGEQGPRRPQGPPRGAVLHLAFRRGQGDRLALRQCGARRRWGRCSASSWFWRTRAPPSSSASPRSTSTTS